jgi:type II secretory pathway predicted ATPase ExeA
MTAQLKKRLAKCGLTQVDIARRLGVSTASVSLCLAHSKYPKGRPNLAREISAEITKQNAQSDSSGRLTTAQAAMKLKKEEDPMLLQKQTLPSATRRHFGLSADPFANDVCEPSDVYMSADIRYVRETLWQHIMHGGLLALVGESGSGKTTVVADFKDRLQREGRDVIVIEPSVLYMDENDSKGKTLKSASIISAIIHTLAPTEAPKRDPEARARQVQRLLTAGHRAGQRHVLIIEEAHCVPAATLKHLKRFAELKDGLSPLLAIVLVGQPELRQRLSVNNAEVREVAQRCDLIELPALDNHLDDYLKFKLARVGAALDKVITQDGIDALRERLTFARKTNSKSHMPAAAVSLVYPLAVANALTAALNLAAHLGAPVVDAAIVKEA